MPAKYLRYASLQPYLQSDPPAGGGNPPEPPTPPPADPPLGEKGEKALQEERDARREADKRAKAAETKLAEIEAAKVKADEQKAKEQGEWQTLAEKREADLTKATTDLETTTTELTALRDYFTTQFDAALKDLPDVVKAFAPPADASFETKSKWLTTAQAEARKLEKAKPRGAGFDPPPGTKPLDITQEAAKARARGAYRT